MGLRVLGFGFLSSRLGFKLRHLELLERVT